MKRNKTKIPIYIYVYNRKGKLIFGTKILEPHFPHARFTFSAYTVQVHTRSKTSSHIHTFQNYKPLTIYERRKCFKQRLTYTHLGAPLLYYLILIHIYTHAIIFILYVPLYTHTNLT